MNYEEKLQIIQAGCPKLRFSAQFTDQSSQWNYSRHAHPYLELLYFTEGGGGIVVAGQGLCAGFLDRSVYPAGWEHQEQASAARKREIICLWIELPELQLEKPIQIRDHDNLFGRLFSYLYREASRPDASEYVLEYGIKLLLTELLRCDAHQTHTPERLQLVMQYLQANYAKPITLSGTCERLLSVTAVPPVYGKDRHYVSQRAAGTGGAGAADSDGRAGRDDRGAGRL